jgi:hypothetical protein
MNVHLSRDTEYDTTNMARHTQRQNTLGTRQLIIKSVQDAENVLNIVPSELMPSRETMVNQKPLSRTLTTA